MKKEDDVKSQLKRESLAHHYLLLTQIVFLDETLFSALSQTQKAPGTHAQ